MRDTRALSTATGRSAVRSAGLHLERSTGSIRSGLTALKRTYLARMFFNRWSDWADRSAMLGVSLARVRSYRLVVSSGPPHMAHVSAQRIARETRMPHVLDLRDPWF